MTIQDPTKKLVVLYAPPGLTGHLIPTVEFGKLLVAQGLEVTVVIAVEAGVDDQGAVSDIATANPSLSFQSLPAATLPSEANSYEAKVFDLVRASNLDLRGFLRSASRTPTALVVDLFCCSALDVGAELGIPTYVFLTHCIGILAFSLYLPVLHEQTTLSFRDLGGDLVHAPGLPPIPAGDILEPLQDLIVNSFRSLEPRAAHAVVSGLCTVPGRPTPPLYCVGPMVKTEAEEERHDHECLAWLDAQPAASVVFLCFGSMGRFGAKQLREIAAGLEASRQRFLWAVRQPPDGDDDEHRLELDGFRQRTKDRGLVLTSWAPQREVLAHGAVGGYVTHCGWNSVLEAVTAGVPMLAWPLYAEQRMNKVFLVEEMRLALAMEGYDKGMVEAEEVAAKVTWLMESQGGRELRQRAQAAKQRAEAALMSDGGESKAALMKLAIRCKSTDDHKTGYGTTPPADDHKTGYGTTPAADVPEETEHDGGDLAVGKARLSLD